jgi:hypothetical protein
MFVHHCFIVLVPLQNLHHSTSSKKVAAAASAMVYVFPLFSSSPSSPSFAGFRDLGRHVKPKKSPAPL